MFGLIKYLIIATAIVLGIEYFLPGVTIQGRQVAVQVVVILYLANVLIGKILKFILAPLNFISFGLVGLAINVLMIHLTSMYIDGFTISDTVSLLLFAIALMISGFLFRTKLL